MSDTGETLQKLSNTNIVSSDGTTYTKMGSTTVVSDGSVFTQMGSFSTGGSTRTAANVELTVSLGMASPSETSKLNALAERLLHQPKIYSETSPMFEQPEASRPGILGAIGALAFGIGITKADFGRNHG